MNSLGALALRYLKVNRRQSVFIAVCASLSVALCAFFLTVFSSGLATLRDNSEEYYGSWQAVVTGLDETQAKNLAANAAFSDTQIQRQTFPKSGLATSFDFFYTRTTPIEDGYIYSLYAGGSAELINPCYISTMDNSPGKLYTPELLEGRFPDDPYEIVLPAYASQKVGDRITVDLKRQEIAETPFLGAVPGRCLEIWEKVYTVCGIAGGVNPESTYIHPDDGFFTKSYTAAPYRVFVRFAGRAENYTSLLMELCERENIEISSVNRFTSLDYLNFADGIEPKGITFNDVLLKGEVSGSEAFADMVIYFAVMCVFLLIILAFGRVVIDCEFQQISASKQHDIGLLMAIGATDGQLYAVSIFEGLILGAAAVPAGIVFGAGLAGAAVRVMNRTEFLRDILPAGIVFRIDPLFMALAAVMGIGWVFFSSYGIGVKIKKVNPVEAMEGMRKSGKSPFPEQNAKNPELYKKLHAAFLLTPVKKNGKSKKRIILTPFDKLSPENFLQRLSAAVARIDRQRFTAASFSMAMGIFLFSAVAFSLWAAEHDVFRIDSVSIADGYEFAADGKKYFTEREGNEYYDRLINEAAEQGIRMEKAWFWTWDFDMVYALFDERELEDIYPGTTLGQNISNLSSITEEYFNSEKWGMSYEEAVENNCFFMTSLFGNTIPDHDSPAQIITKKITITLDPRYINAVPLFDIYGLREEGYGEAREIKKEITAVFEVKPYQPVYDIYGNEEKVEVNCWSIGMPEESYKAFMNELCNEYFPELEDYPISCEVEIGLEPGTDITAAREWLRENMGYYSVSDLYIAEVSVMYALFKVIGIILTVTAALIAFANAVNVTMSGILENRRGFALMRAAGMTDEQLEGSALRQAAEPVIWAAVISLVLFSVFMLNAWARFFMSFEAGNILIGYLAYFIGVAVTLGISLLSALPAIREIENEEIAVGVKPMVE